jgi:hypothetical protein
MRFEVPTRRRRPPGLLMEGSSSSLGLPFRVVLE